MKAYLKNYRQAPRKVRLVANLIKGKLVANADLELKHLAKRAALPMEKLLASAVANAKVAGENPENLIVKNVTVDKGLVMKRMMPRAFGRGAPIHKHMCHVTLTLGLATPKKVKMAKKEVVKETKKVVKNIKSPKKAKVIAEAEK